MSRFVEELELELWKRELDKAEESVRKAQVELDNDPTTVILDCNKKFAELLDQNKGEARHTKAFQNQVSYLAKLEQRAKLRHKSYDLLKTMDRLNDAKVKRDQIAHKYHMVKFHYDLARERNEKVREKMIVEDIIDKVSK